jgi:uncharacterized protein
MQRKQLREIEKWLASRGRKPLLIRGARQVGKSTLVQLFAEQRGLSLTEANLERYPALATAFESTNPTVILNQIEAPPNLRAVADNSLLFLYESQAVPRAIPALREDFPKYAGSRNLSRME